MDFVTPHVLRHLTATSWAVNGADVKAIKQKLGQKDIRTMMIYLEHNEDQADKVIREASRRRSLEREAELEKSNVAGAKREQSEES